MSNQVAVPADLADMAAALQQSSAQAGAAGGSDLYAKMTKFGDFVYGADGTEFEEGSVWAVNPNGFQHGHICWDEGTPTGEVLVPATQPMPSEADLPAVSGKWGKQVAIQMRATNGEDEGIQVLFKSNSLGGRKAYATLLQAVIARIQAGKADCVPLVECHNDHYDHKTYGKIFTPEFKVVGWANREGERAEEPAAAIEAPTEPAEKPAEPEAAPRRRRRKAA